MAESENPQSTAQQKTNLIRISILAFIFGLVGLIMLLSASAAVDVRFTMSTSASVTVPNEEVVVELNMDTVTSTVYALETTLTYDPAVLEFVGASTSGNYAAALNRVGGELNNNGEVKYPDVPVGEINIVRASPDDPIQGVAQIVAITFRAISNNAINSAVSISDQSTYVLEPNSDENIYEGSNAVAITVDGVNPTVSVTSPLAGSVVGGDLPITVNATDNHGVDSVEVLVGGQVVHTFIAEPYTVMFDTRQLADGEHMVFARAADVAGNTTDGASSAVAFVVDNTAPVIGATNPASDAVVEGTVTLSADVADPGSDVEAVTFYIDDIEVGTDAATPFEVQWDSTSVGDGVHVMRVETLDRTGNVANSKSVTFQVSNDQIGVPASVTILAPEEGDTVAGDVAVSAVLAEFSEPIGTVSLLVNGTIVDEDTTFPYAFLWDSTTGANGSVELVAQALNNDALVRSSAVTVNVSNNTASSNSDINEDGIVGLEDLSILVFNWQRTSGFGRADVNRDGVVNIFDLSRLLSNWDI